MKITDYAAMAKIQDGIKDKNFAICKWNQTCDAPGPGPVKFYKPQTSDVAPDVPTIACTEFKTWSSDSGITARFEVQYEPK